MKWEYTYSDGDLNALGAEGWEAVGIIKYEDGFEVLMKRPIPDPDAVVIMPSARYGIFLNTGPSSSGWLKDADGYVMSSASRIVMEAQASELDASWGAEVRMMP